MEPKEISSTPSRPLGARGHVDRAPPSGRRPLRAPVVLTAAQARALQAMAAAPDASLRGISWMTARALRALGLCELGPGRRGRLTREGRVALAELTRGEAASVPALPGASTAPAASREGKRD